MQFRNSKPFALLVLAAATSAGAIGANLETFRTLALLRGVAQGQDSVTGAPQLDAVTLRGFQLVNLAMGRPIADISHPEQVLAMTIACDLDAAQLVVYDRSASRDVATIAESKSVDSVRSQRRRRTARSSSRASTSTRTAMRPTASRAASPRWPADCISIRRRAVRTRSSSRSTRTRTTSSSAMPTSPARTIWRRGRMSCAQGTPT
jgi:hypothetical protein